jgi:hypothetical protein
MGDLRPADGYAETDNVKRQQAWCAAGEGRTIDVDGCGWWEARQLGVLLMRRQYLGQLMDALARR